MAIAAICLGAQAFAQTSPLSELALFHRCYTQITSLRAKSSDPLTQAVANGQSKAVDACMQVFNSAQLSGTPMKLANSQDARAQSVLATFHRLHASWFYSKDFPVISWPGHAGDMRDLYDSTSPALYYTRALFGAGVSASDPVTSHDFLRAVRTTPSPNVGPESGHPLSDFIFTSSFSFAPKGTLLGVESAAGNTVSYAASPGVQPGAGSINLYSNLGGGFLGTVPYINLNTSPLSSYTDFQTDGGISMHRRYGKAVYRDTLCRDLPVIRETDSNPFVDTNSPVPFRKTTACAKCHASHDRVSGVIRGMFIRYIGSGDPSGIGSVSRGGNFPIFHPVTKPAESGWPSMPDADYYQRPTNGEIYFRDYNGNLVDQSVTSVDDLGQHIAGMDDYYICLARRYYRYFTGIDVNTGDLADPTHIIQLNDVDAVHRKNVVTLGLALKQSKSLPTMIKSILSLDAYKRADFGVKGANSGP